MWLLLTAATHAPFEGMALCTCRHLHTGVLDHGAHLGLGPWRPDISQSNTRLSKPEFSASMHWQMTATAQKLSPNRYGKLTSLHACTCCHDAQAFCRLLHWPGFIYCTPMRAPYHFCTCMPATQQSVGQQQPKPPTSHQSSTSPMQLPMTCVLKIAGVTAPKVPTPNSSPPIRKPHAARNDTPWAAVSKYFQGLHIQSRYRRYGQFLHAAQWSDLKRADFSQYRGCHCTAHYRVDYGKQRSGVIRRRPPLA